MFLTIKPSNCQTFTKDHQQQDCSSTRISVKQLKYVHTTLKKVFSFVYVVSSIFIVYMYSQTLSWSLTKVLEIPLIAVKLTCIKQGSCIKRSPFGNGSLTAQYRLTVFFNTGLTNLRFIQENEGKERNIYPTTNWPSSVSSTSSWAKRKKVKDRLTPYTVRPVALVWYVFPKWAFNGGEDNKK